MSRIHVITFVTASIVAVACSDATGISMEYTAITPEVVALEVRVSGGMLVVELELADPDIQLPDNVRIPVTVKSSSEDVEIALLRPSVCQDPKFGPVFCGEFEIGTEQDEVDALAARLREYSAFIVMEVTGGVFAYFPYGTSAEILHTVGRWPGVLHVQPSVVKFTSGDTRPGTPRLFVSGYLPLEAASVTPGNNFLEAESLDVLSVEYTPPTGPVLAKTVVLQ